MGNEFFKKLISRIKQWFGFKLPMRAKDQQLSKWLVEFYDINHNNDKFFVIVVVFKIAVLVFMAWRIGLNLIQRLDEWSEWFGGATRCVLTFAFGWLFFAIMRAVFRYKPIRRDRLMFGRSRKDRSGWGMAMYSLLAVFIILFFICTVGLIALQARAHDQVFDERNHTLRIVWGILSQFADPGNLPQAVGWGKLVALMSAFAGILCLSGFVITSLVSMITRRTQYWHRGLIRYDRDFQNYVVVIGMNEQTANIVKRSLRRNDVDYVLVQTRRNVEEQRAKLELKLDRQDEDRVVFYFGERTHYEDITDLHLENAREVYVLGEDMSCENEQDHDSHNMKCLELISQYCQELSREGNNTIKRWWGKKLKCHVELEYQSTYTIFKSTRMYKRLNQSLEFVPFNVYEIWAKKVLVDTYAILPGKKNDEHMVQRYQPIDSYRDPETREVVGITYDSDKSVHLIVIGMNQMGIALAMQAALLVHLPNYHTKGVRTTITFIDEHAAQEGEYLMGHYEALFSLCRHRTIMCGRNTEIKTWEQEKLNEVDPMASAEGRYSHLGENFMDIQWEFIEGSTAWPSVRKYLERETTDPQQTCTIAVCHNDPQQSIATALYLPERVLKRVQQVLVYQRNNFDLIDKVATGEKQWKRYEKLKPFGMIADCYKGDMFEALVPKLVLALYKSNKDVLKRSIRTQTADIDSYVNYIDSQWSEEGIVNKMSNINVAESFSSKLRSVGLSEFSSGKEINQVLSHKPTVDALVAAEHQRWVTERLTMGFRPLDAKEMAYFEDLTKNNPGPLPIEGKSKKELFKAKSRAHLDICSTSKLDEIDPGVSGNDRVIIKNLLRGTFMKMANRIISRLALREEMDGEVKSEDLAVAKWFLDSMKRVEGDVLTRSDGSKELIPGMWIGEFPVTQEQWKRIMGNEKNPSIGAGEDTDKHPVNNVSKEDVEDFILILNDMTGLRFSLPSESEWLFAALGGLRIQNFNEPKIEKQAWLNPGTSGLHTSPVGRKTPNGYGLYDMLGNVWEWTKTKHGASTYCYCGGSWRFTAKECNLADPSEPWSNYWIPEHKSDDLGFRLVLYHAFEKNDADRQKPMGEITKMIGNIIQHMKKVHAGEFIMGTDKEEVSDGTPMNLTVNTLTDERPAHRVYVSEFFISDIPVTQRHYKAITEETPSEQKGVELPVEGVSYLDAVAFIDKLNKECCKLLPDTIIPPGGVIFALPTQAQWEYAARGGCVPPSTYTVYSGSNNPDVVAWHFGNTKGTHAVGMKIANQVDLKDMCGNVWEWCSDWYEPDYYEQCRGKDKGLIENLQINPKGPKSGITHVLRGGSWRFTAGECRLTRVSHWPEDYKANDVGFRLVANVSKSVLDTLLLCISRKAKNDSSGLKVTESPNESHRGDAAPQV